MITNRYSASKLLKHSSAQLVYFRRTGTNPPITPNIIAGEKYQHSVSDKSREDGHNVCDEMCGHYDFGDNAIYFCIDFVREDGFFEVKSVNNPSSYEQWYFEASILQCAVYKALLNAMGGNTLVTPKFRLDEGYSYQSIEANKSLPYKLIFGDVGTYIVDVTDGERLIRFLKEKINSLKDYNTARAFDAKYKHKEFSLLRNCFTYKKVS